MFYNNNNWYQITLSFYFHYANYSMSSKLLIACIEKVSIFHFKITSYHYFGFDSERLYIVSLHLHCSHKYLVSLHLHSHKYSLLLVVLKKLVAICLACVIICGHLFLWSHMYPIQTKQHCL